MSTDVLERLRAADPAVRLPEPDPDDRERLRRAIVARPRQRRARAWWRRRLEGRTLVVLLGGAVLLASGTVYAARLVMSSQETSVTLRSGTWQRLPLAVDGGEVLALAIDPKNTDVLYAGTAEGLFKSNDAAATWKRLQVGRDVRSITVDPQDPSHLFVFAPGEPGPNGVVESHDGGASWSVISSFAHTYMGIVRFGVDASSSPSTLYVAGYGYVGGFFRSGDGGRTWRQLDTGVEAQGPSELAIDPLTHTVYASYRRSHTDSVLVCSYDGGATWHDITSNLPPAVRSAEPIGLRVDPADTSRLLLSARGKVLASSDQGWTWAELGGEARDWAVAVLNAAPGTPASAVQAASAFLSPFTRLATARRLTDAASDLPLAGVQPPVIVDSRDPSTLYLATAQGVYKSTDTGATWHKASEGIKDHNVFKVLVDRRSPSTLLALTPTGLVRSTDGGSTYVTLLPAAVTTAVAAPSSPSTLYATTPSGVLKSTDGGETWSRPRHKGLPAEPGSLDVAMVASDRPGTVYINADGVIFKSTDGGRTWRRVEGLPRDAGVRLLQEVPGDPSTIFAAVYGSGGPGPSHAGRLFRSTDRGRTWAKIGDASWGAGPLTLAIDPRTPSQMLIATEERPVWHRSTDGGKSWHHFTVRGPAMYPEYLVFDPRRRHTVYAVTWWDERRDDLDPAVYRSRDGGATWEDISSGLPDYWLEDWPTLVFAATPGGALYAATESGLYKWIPTGP